MYKSLIIRVKNYLLIPDKRTIQVVLARRDQTDDIHFQPTQRLNVDV